LKIVIVKFLLLLMIEHIC